MSRDLRHYARQTNVRLLFGFVAILILIGDGLIYLIYGQNAALFGLICLLGGLAPVVLAWSLLAVIGWLVKKIDEG